MSKIYTSRTALSIAVAALVSACGGGESPRSAAQEFTDALRPEVARSDRLRALAAGAGGGETVAAATVAITNAQLFQGAEAIFPDLFPTNTAPIPINNLPYEGKVFQVRAYANGNYLGVASDGNVYGLGGYTNGQLANFGALQSFADLVCSRINCGTTGGGGGGTLNECAQPAADALRTGNRYTAVFAQTVFAPTSSSGEYTTEGVVEGAATFEGQSAIRVASTVRGFQAGQTVDATVKAYEQIADGGLTRSLGAETNASFAGFNLLLRTVYNPAVLNTEFTLRVGESISKTMNTTSTYINAPFPLPPTSGSSTTTHTYLARESVTVLGRTYDTCKYRDTTAGADITGFSWYIVGKGIPAKHESTNAAGTVVERTELKSATINGAPI